MRSLKDVQISCELKKRTYLWIFSLYLLFSVFLIFSRLPFIDEAWYTNVSVTFLREGAALDLTWCKPDRYIPFSLVPTSLTYALWYKIGTVNIVWGRLLSVIAGLLFLLFIYRCFSLIKIPSSARNIAIGLGGINYLFLLATTQIRPEGLALFASAVSLYMYLRWQQDTRSLPTIFLAHIFAILAAMFHLQATFIGIGLWMSMLLINRKEIRLRHLIAIMIPYVLAIIVGLIYVYPLRAEFIRHFQVLFGGDMQGHRGGIIATCIGFLENTEYFRLVANSTTIVVIGIGIAVSWFTNKRNQGFYAFFIYALCGYVSWITTTSNLHDYHSSWLVPAFMIITVTCVINLSSNSVFKRTFYYGLLMSPVLAGLLGAFFAINTIYKNPKVNVYDRELKLFDSKYKLSNSTVYGRREIMWYFNFDHNIVFPLRGSPRYYIGLSIDVPYEGRINICDSQYGLIERGKEFALYRRINEAE
jgi:hypothetical protein